MRKNSVIKLPAVSFAAVGAIYLIYFAVFGFYPFGDRSIAWCDLEQQYLPLLMELRSIIINSGSFFLGKGGGGMNLWGVILFFVSSPIGLISLAVKAADMVYFINILTVLKLALCGASASFCFGRQFEKLPNCFNILLSVMYSFSGYVMMYYQNNMWLDVMIIFPLLNLSMLRLSEKGGWKLYAVLLSLTMILNFYLSYMIVIYIMISFALMLYFCCEPEKRGAASLQFLIADVCAALATAVVWIPAAKQFASSGRGESFSEKFNSGGFFSYADDKLAMLLCTSITVAAVIAMLMNPRLFRRGKAGFYRLMTLVLIIGAFIDPIDKIWHTGSYQAYPLRFGFIIIFLTLSDAAVILSSRIKPERLDNKKKYDCMTAVIMAAAAAVLTAGIITHKNYISYTSSLWISGKDSLVLILCGIIGAFAYLVILLRYRKRKLGIKISALCMSGLVLCESLFGFGIYFDNITDVTKRFNQTMQLCDKIDDDEDFWRAKSSRRYFYSNMLEAMGFNSIAHYTSLTDRDFLYTAKKLGYSAYWMDVSTNGGTLMTDAFLMNKYIIGQSGDENAYYEDYNSEDALSIFENTVVSSGALISQLNPDELSGFDDTQRMESTAYIAEKLYGAENVLQKPEPYVTKNLEYSEENGKYTLKIIDADEQATVNYSLFVSGKQELYADVFGNYSTAVKEKYFESVSVYVNGKRVSDYYPNKKENGILDLGTYKNQYVSVKIVVHKDIEVDEFGIYLLDSEKIKECTANASTAKITLDGSKIIIEADSSEGGYVYIPFAFNNGYSAVINGSDTEIYKTLGSFMAVKLEKGSSRIVLSFCPDGFRTGAVLSIAGALIFALLCIFGGKMTKKHGGKIEKISRIIVYIMSAAVFAAVYILSSAAWIL